MGLIDRLRYKYIGSLLYIRSENKNGYILGETKGIMHIKNIDR